MIPASRGRKSPDRLANNPIQPLTQLARQRREVFAHAVNEVPGNAVCGAGGWATESQAVPDPRSPAVAAPAAGGFYEAGFSLPNR